MAVTAVMYVAMYGWDYEGESIIGVFNKPEKARKAIDDHVGGDYVEIQVFEMNNDGGPLWDHPEAVFEKRR